MRGIISSRTTAARAVAALFLCVMGIGRLGFDVEFMGVQGQDILSRVPNTWVEPSMGSLADLVRFSDQRKSVNAIIREYNIMQFARLAKTQNLFKKIAVERAGKYTVFAPVDSAFQNLPPFVLPYLQKNPQVLEKVLTNHVVEGEYFLADLSPDQPLVSLEGSPLRITFSGSNVEVNGANIIKPHDIIGVDGILHLVDKVIVPEDVQLPPCPARCREVIAGNSDLNQLDGGAQQKFCALQCAGVTPNNDNNKIFSKEKKSLASPKDIDGVSFLEMVNPALGSPATGPRIGPAGTGTASQPMLPIARPLMERALSQQYGTRAGGRVLDECTSDCIRQGVRDSVIQTFAQRQLLEGSCLDNCANLLQTTVARPPDRRTMCMTACTSQGIDGDRCILSCGQAAEDRRSTRTNMRGNCESMCADSPDFSTCVGQCTNTRGEKSTMTGRPHHLASDRQRAFFEARAAHYRR